jgi:hypothetical protein
MYPKNGGKRRFVPTTHTTGRQIPQCSQRQANLKAHTPVVLPSHPHSAHKRLQTRCFFFPVAVFITWVCNVFQEAVHSCQYRRDVAWDSNILHRKSQGQLNRKLATGGVSTYQTPASLSTATCISHVAS